MITIQIWKGAQDRQVETPLYTLEIGGVSKLVLGSNELAGLAALGEIANSFKSIAKAAETLTDPATATDKIMDWMDD